MPCAMPRAAVMVLMILICAFALSLYGVLRLTPYPELAAYQNRSYGFAALDRNGRLLRVFPAADGVKREWAALEAIPHRVLTIFINAEDRRFYLHPGVDPIAIAAAAVRNLRAGRTVSGASTITMQLARLIKPRGNGLWGKAHEAWDALRLEARLSKAHILELWINGIPFGSNIEGLPAASRARFGREAAALDDARAVLLAVIPRRPGLYDPARISSATRTPSTAQNSSAAIRAALALSRRCGLKPDEAALIEAAADAAPDRLTGDKTPFHAPHFTERAALSAAPRNGPLRTTLDLDLQLYAERLLAREVALLENSRVGNGALLAIDNASGAVLAYAGSASWFDNTRGGKIDGVQIRNQPGSCLKPFLYALALERGFSPNSILPDIPAVFGGGEAYTPANFNRRFNGPVRFRVALASSLNIPAVYLLERVGVHVFEDWLIGLGFESIAAIKGSVGAGLALGNAEVSLEELTRAFAVFPRGGLVLELQFTENQHTSLAAARRIMPPYSAWAITDILSDKASRFTGFGPAPVLATDFPSMFKTGTANQFQHIWALGASARYTVGVWMGNVSGETVIGRTGSSVPARIAADVLTVLEQTGSRIAPRNFPPLPTDAHETRICSLSGMAAGPACPGITAERLLDAMIPASCTWHRRPDGVPEYPGEYRAWLAERFRQGRAGRESSGGPSIRLPISGSVFYLDPSLPPEAQAVRVETSGFTPGALVYVNDILEGSVNHAGIFALPLRRGFLRVTVEDANGSGAVTIEVR